MRIMIVGLFALLGCEPPAVAYQVQGPARSTKLNEPPRAMPARSPSSVAVYQVKLPAEPFVEVYRIADLGQNENVALDTMRRSSAMLGCDALIVGNSIVESVIAGSIQQVSLSGTCVMFTKDPGAWRAPEPEPQASTQASPEPSKPLSRDSEACVQGRAKIFATKNPRERARRAASLPPACHQ